MLVLDLAKLVKEAAKKNGMLAWQYNTVGVSDGITMGNDGKHIVLDYRSKICRDEVLAAVKGDHRRQH